jgi:hypothetical protein
VRAAQDELDNRAIILELSQALSVGSVQVSNGKLFTGYTDVKQLSEAIALSNRLGPKTAEAKLMLLTAKAVKRLRQALLSGDYAEAKSVLESLTGKRIATVAISEIRMAQDAVDNWVRDWLTSGGSG